LLQHSLLKKGAKVLKKIVALKEFGSYKKFVWPADTQLAPFKKFNLIYGWNYSGKTTISRLFDCLKAGKLATPFEQSKFEISFSDGATSSDKSFSSNPSIHVFNVDYVRRNLRWDQPEQGAEPVFILGEKNIELQKSLDAAFAKHTELCAVIASNDVQGTELSKTLNDKLTDEARKIKQQLWADRSDAFERPQLKAAIDKLHANHVRNQLDTTTYASEFAKFMARKLAEIEPPSLPTPQTALRDIGQSILSRTPTGNSLAELQHNPKLNLWAKQGWEMHEHFPGTACQFCGNALTQSRVDSLNAHFSSEYQKQLDELILVKESYKKSVSALSGLESLKFNKGNFYEHLSLDAERYIAGFQNAVRSERERLTYAISLLEKKERNLFQVTEVSVSSTSEALKLSMEGLRGLVDRHNEYGKKLQSEKEAARGNLTLNAVSQAAVAISYFDGINRINELKARTAIARTEAESLEASLLNLRRQLDESVKGAQKINDYLSTYLSKNELRIQSNSQKRFEVRRGHNVATHLSEGEKTAVSFAHFMATLENRGAKIEDAIVFVDDPISSLDSNHLYGVFALIERHLANASQLFVSTHNHEFFDLLLDWRKNKSGNPKDDTSVYLVRRAVSAGVVESEIAALPQELIQFRSEYLYLFSIIARCERNAIQDGELLILPNALRRFLEAFMRFKYVGKNEADRWKTCFGDVGERVRKYVHSGSHENSMKSTTLPDRQEAVEVAKLVLQMLARVDPDHYSGLCSKCSG
jgi:wobble nucleotide-excising tRNase